MACHAPAWAAVGAENAPVNQPRVAGEKPSRARCAELTMRPSCTRPLTIALTWANGVRRESAGAGRGRWGRERAYGGWNVAGRRTERRGRGAGTGRWSVLGTGGT